MSAEYSRQKQDKNTTTSQNFGKNFAKAEGAELPHPYIGSRGSLTQIPQELRSRDQWVRWKMADGRKVPFTLSDQRASSTNPSTWGPLEGCAKSLAGYLGVGFMLEEDDPYTFIDM